MSATSLTNALIMIRCSQEDIRLITHDYAILYFISYASHDFSWPSHRALRTFRPLGARAFRLAKAGAVGHFLPIEAAQIIGRDCPPAD